MSDIKFRLGLDGREFDKGLDNAQKKASAFGEATEDVGRKLQRTFGAGDVFKGLLQGVGIGSLEGIVQLIATPWRKAAEYAEKTLDFTQRWAIASKRFLELRNSDEQNLNILKKEEAVLGRQLVQYADRKLNEKDALEGARIRAELVEKGVEIAEMEGKIRLANEAREKAISTGREAIADKERANVREMLEDEAKRAALLEESNKLYHEATFIQDDEVEQQKLILRSLDFQNEANKLGKKIEEDKARAIEKVAEEEKKQTEEIEKQREVREKANEEAAKALVKATEARKEIRDARAEQFAFTLGEAAQGSRGSRGAGRAAKLFDQKSKQLNSIVDQGNFQVAFNDDGSPTLSSRDPSRKDAAQQATGRFRKLFGDREALRGSINNLAATDKDPFTAQKKAYKEALDESKKLTQIAATLEGKFLNQADGEF